MSSYFKGLWERAKLEEIKFWKEYLSTGGLEWKDDFERRTNPQSQFIEKLIIDRLPEIPYDTISILDVGAGPLTMLGYKLQNKELKITAVDPLAKEYARLLNELNILSPLQTIFCHGEKLMDKFKPNSFDFAYARNSLDHSYDPILIIENMLRVVKNNQYVILRHSINEAEKRSYFGLHQWNFELRGNDFIIWNHAILYNVSHLLSNDAQIYCHNEDEWLVCIMKKIPN